MKYDDGFVAYLNGQEVARQNVTGQAAWNQTADQPRPDEDAIRFQDIDISQSLPLLVSGTNVLAIQGLNSSAADEDFLILPRLIDRGDGFLPGLVRYFSEPTPGAQNGVVTADVGPIITEVSEPSGALAATDPLLVTATVTPTFEDPGEVFLYYRVTFGEEVSVPMLDDGASGDGLDGNGALFKMFNSLTDPVVRSYSFYRNDNTKRTREWDPTWDLDELVAGVDENNPDRFQYVMDKVNIPAMINYLAATVTEADWHPATDGDGFSLVIIDPLGVTDSWDTGLAWRPSFEPGGSPGEQDVMLGDLDKNNRVGLTDLAIGQANLDATDAMRSQGDLTGDALVTRADVATMLRNFGRSYNQPAASLAPAAAASIAVRNTAVRNTAVRNTVNGHSEETLYPTRPASRTVVSQVRRNRPARRLAQAAVDVVLTDQSVQRPIRPSQRLLLRASRSHRIGERNGAVEQESSDQ